MSHMCTRCRNVFDEGTDILRGCPVCGWKKFMFVKSRPVKDPATDVQKTESGLSKLEKTGIDKTPVGVTTEPESKVESIRITEPGTYELNLPTLFEREELIMAVKEGTYLIDLSSAFRKPKKDKVQNQDE